MVRHISDNGPQLLSSPADKKRTLACSYIDAVSPAPIAVVKGASSNHPLQPKPTPQAHSVLPVRGLNRKSAEADDQALRNCLTKSLRKTKSCHIRSSKTSQPNHLRPPARTIHQSCDSECSRFDGRRMECATRAIQDCLERGGALTKDLTLPSPSLWLGCESSTSLPHSSHVAPSLALQQTLTCRAAGQRKQTQDHANATS